MNTFPITIQRIEKILGKRRLELVLEIAQDSECTEVILKFPYANTHWQETAHVISHDHFASWDDGGGLTVTDYRDELIEWFDNVAEDPGNRNYSPEVAYRQRLAKVIREGV